MKELQEVLAQVEPGPIAALPGLDRLIAARWDELDGSGDGGMEGSKLIGRMEHVIWEPPILNFVIERHGGTVCGSTRAELQHWSVDLDERTAEITKTGYRQLDAMAARVSIKSMAAEVAEQILNNEDDPRLQRLDDGIVKVLASSIFPSDSGYKRTVEGRRQRLCGYIGDILAEHGWEKLGWNRFKKSNSDHPYPVENTISPYFE